jgi:hypothetical protein
MLVNVASEKNKPSIKALGKIGVIILWGLLI